MEETVEAYPVQKGRTPWRRYFARGIDSSIYGILVGVLLVKIAGEGLLWNIFGTYVGLLIGYIITIIVEPYLLSRFGTTLGKRFFSIRVLQENGEKLTLAQARKRTFSLFRYGLGYGIPIYSEIRHIMSYGKCKRSELVWDDGISYEMDESHGGLRIIGAMVICAVVNHLADKVMALFM